MKQLISLTFALIIFSGFALATPSYSHATSTCTHNCSINDKDKKEKENKKEKEDKKHDKKDKDPKDHDECEVSTAHYGKDDEKWDKCHSHEVPEFGMIPAAFALVASSGSYLYIKRRKIN